MTYDGPDEGALLAQVIDAIDMLERRYGFWPYTPAIRAALDTTSESVTAVLDEAVRLGLVEAIGWGSAYSRRWRLL